MISCRDWWPWTKHGYITMARRQNNNQWSGGIAAHPAPNFPIAKIRCRSSGLDLWYQDGVLLIDYLPKGQTINAGYYLSLFVQLKDILKGKTPQEIQQGGLVFHDNAPAHRALATQKKLAYLCFECLYHPPYSLDIAPSDYHPFPVLKKELKGRHFSSDAEIISATETWLEAQISEVFWVAFKS